MSVHVQLMIGTEVFHSPRVLAFMGNPVSCAQADGNGNMSSVLTS